MKINLDWLENFYNEQKEKGNVDVINIIEMMQNIEKNDKDVVEKMLNVYNEIGKIKDTQSHRNLVNIFNTTKNKLQWYDNLVVNCYVKEDDEAIKIIKYISETENKETTENINKLQEMISAYNGDEKIKVKLQRKFSFLSKRLDRGFSDDFGALIKSARVEKGLSLNTLGTLADVSPSYIHRIEKGNKKSPTYKIIESLANVLDLDVNELLRISNGNTIKPKEIMSFSEVIFGNNFSINGEVVTKEVKELILNITNFVINSKWDVNTKFEEQLKLINIIDVFKENNKQNK